MKFKCSKCGAEFSKWAGRCFNCQEWGCLVEDFENSAPQSKSSAKTIELSGKPLKVSSVSDAAATKTKTSRISTNYPEIDRVLGGGFVRGQTVLLSGAPGIGKSTLAMQIADGTEIPTLYVSGEETIEQLGERAERICRKNSAISLAYGTDISAIASTSKEKGVKMLVIDSAQTLSHKEAKAGNTAFIREAIAEIVRFAKRSGMIILVVGQITKTGDIAGPKTLEHLVDTVLFVEGERDGKLRIGRCLKNRYGRTDCVAVFEMTRRGMSAVQDPSTAFIGKSSSAQTGVARTVTLEGQSPLAVEIQSLVANTVFSLPKRVANGVNYNKLFTLVGALDQYLALGLGKFDMFVNVGGGISVKDPCCDLAICSSIYSSAKAIGIPGKCFFAGEVELSGNVKVPPEIETRAHIIAGCGGDTIVTGASGRAPKIKAKGIEVIRIQNIKELRSVFMKLQNRNAT